MSDTLGRLLLLALLLVPGVTRAALPADYRVHLLTENFPPFNMAADGRNFARDDQVQGLSAALVRELFARAGIAYSLTLRFPWDRVYRHTLENPGSGLFSTARLPEREAQFKWVGPIAEYHSVLVAAPGREFALSDLEQARAYRIGAYKSAAVSQLLERRGIAASAALNDQDNIGKLQRGQIDLWATSAPVWQHHARLAGASGLHEVLRLQTDPLYLALHRDTPDEVVQRLQRALDQMRSEGWSACTRQPQLCQ
ncbi:ABC transporter substrate-binding protein [Pseudomonas sp. AN-1]|jgi:polar amino acid transport system substrate-binding protein|uniref:substrate-binding periplasmic protein n=1 Tax=Pseudomonas sp. AN-1 TaxID=3096605 RepID=UPI002A6AE363|nr:ABC transporter substrate-binding protein [Pseudomonas sp. AN-1]WPP44415.1 ABC transporter substrate-binding protein [Pseudomonas sp. AN-1]